jgi:hypothetical protein
MSQETEVLPDPRSEPTIDLPRAGRLLGIGRTAAYATAGRGAFPVPVLRAGKRFRVPTAPLLRALGLGDADPSEPHNASGTDQVTALLALVGLELVDGEVISAGPTP